MSSLRTLKTNPFLLFWILITISVLGLNMFLGIFLVSGGELERIENYNRTGKAERSANVAELRAAVVTAQDAVLNLTNALRWIGYLQLISVLANAASLYGAVLYWKKVSAEKVRDT
jgi:hypothetical protein